MLAALPFFWQAPSSSGAAVLLVGGSAGWLFLSPLRREPVTSGAVHSHGDDPGRAARSLGPPARRWRPVGRLATSHHRGDPGRQRVPVAVAPGDLQQLSGFSVGRADRDGGGDRPRMARGDARPAPVGPALARARRGRSGLALPADGDPGRRAGARAIRHRSDCPGARRISRWPSWAAWCSSRRRR
jgi:hypothetical protein